MDFAYDDQNIFAKILRGEIPNKTVYEDDYALAFHDIAPQAPVHVLVIPKGPFMSLDHFTRDASDAEITGYMRAISKTCEMIGVEDGFRAIANARAQGGQEVPHLHVHLLAGRPMGPMLAP
ncbi:histidine triad nucleotide-binding protein [Pseudooctadecabacter jejudonensis]|uniref:HIT-like protein HinT n=1 Tax=Pseudooctadecabacter jejudonensis TaxID=1391910 RepID=A0A1Y5T4Q0_9RHOB|nr:histidine triad nucleotide-binding protein [Pseudooctadecabacter jejudonensis]SLN55903.1 HIT-like protein HinT [Pseudooctadecabacter jejudonensis]